MARQVEPYAALDASGWSAFSMNRAPRCPHCGDDFDITDNEAWRLYDDGETHEVECPSCDRAFTVNSTATWRFSTDEQDRD